MRCTVDHMAEFRTLEECEHTGVHMSLEEMRLAGERAELQSHKDFLKLTRWTRSSQMERPAGQEVRAAKVFRLRGDWDGVSQGVEPSRVELGPPVRLSKGVLGTAEGRGVRLSCSKWERMAPADRDEAKSNRCDERELERALREMGL